MKLDISKHELVPKHIILKEREEILKKYGITPSQLPRILETDPIVSSIGGKAGDVIKVIRKSSTAGEIEYYRVVVRG